MSSPKKHILIALIVALDVILLADIYHKKEVVFNNGQVQAAKIDKANKNVLGVRQVTRRRTSTISIPTLTKRPASTPTPTKKPSSTPTPTKIPTNPIPTGNPQLTISSPTPKPASPTPAKSEPTNSDLGSNLLKQLNEFRSSRGKSSVTSESNTCSFANKRAEEIVNNFNHDGFRSRIDSKSLPFPSYSAIAENIAMNSNPNDVIPAWINSSGHAENMLKDVPHGCIGISGRYYTYIAWKP